MSTKGSHNAAGFAIVVPWFSAAGRGRAVGVVVGGAGLGIFLVGRLVLPLLSSHADGWRYGWAAVGAATPVVGAVTALSLRDHPAAARPAASMLFAVATDGFPLYVAVALYGATVMGFPAVAGALCGDLVGAARASLAVGFNNVAFALGQAIGPTAAGAVFDATGSLQGALLTGAASAALGMATCAIAARRMRVRVALHHD